jgi:hypothetical protein
MSYPDRTSTRWGRLPSGQQGFEHLENGGCGPLYLTAEAFEKRKHELPVGAILSHITALGIHGETLRAVLVPKHGTPP